MIEKLEINFWGEAKCTKDIDEYCCDRLQSFRRML